jgi:hypothetical protein
MFLVLLMVFQTSVAMAVGFVFGRIWQIRHDERRQGFTLPRYDPPTHRSHSAPPEPPNNPQRLDKITRGKRLSAALYTVDER